MELSREMNEVRLPAKVYVCVRMELRTAAAAESLSSVLRKSAKTEMKDNPFLFFFNLFQLALPVFWSPTHNPGTAGTL